MAGDLRRVPSVVPLLPWWPDGTGSLYYWRDQKGVWVQLGSDAVLDEGPVSVMRVIGRGDHDVWCEKRIWRINDQVTLVSRIVREHVLGGRAHEHECFAH